MISQENREALTCIVHQETAWMAERGISWSVSDDFEELRLFGEEISGFLNTTYHPHYRQLGAEDMWCRFADTDGTLIGSMAVCLFRDSTLIDLVESGRLWWDSPPDDWRDKMTLDTSGLLPIGNIAHGGAIMVHRDWRAKMVGDGADRFSNRLIRLTRAHWLTNYDADWWAGTVRSALVENSAVRGAHGISPEDCELFAEGYLPMVGERDRLYAMQVPVQDMIASLMHHTVINLKGS